MKKYSVQKQKMILKRKSDILKKIIYYLWLIFLSSL